MPVNAGLPQDCVLSSTLFPLHINDILEDTVCSGRVSLSRENVDQCQNKLMSSVEEVPQLNISARSVRNLVQFNPKKQTKQNKQTCGVCPLATKKPICRVASITKQSLYGRALSVSSSNTKFGWW